MKKCVESVNYSKENKGNSLSSPLAVLIKYIYFQYEEGYVVFSPTYSHSRSGLPQMKIVVIVVAAAAAVISIHISKDAQNSTHHNGNN